jgi:glycerol-3-phosphate dehydrogenase (NAD(P)+)
MEETAEGVNTTRLIYHLSEHYHWKTPITKLVYKVLFEAFPVQNAISLLMKLPVREDIDFI